MILLAKYPEDRYTPEPVSEFHNYTSLEYFCETTSILEINPLVKKLELPILTSNVLLVNKGYEVLYYMRKENLLYYLINVKHLKFLSLYREYKLNQLEK